MQGVTQYDFLYTGGVSVISSLQSTFPDSESFFVGVSKVADPRYVFTFYFPLVFALHWALGAKLLGTLIVAEWMNQVLKWVMRGERPYWWVHETDSYNTSRVPDLLQYSATCETGPGMPSGHSMVMSSVWYVIVHSAIERLVKPSQKLSASQKQFAIQGLWIAYAAFLALVVMSRMYIAAHFPHQCALGLLLGVCVARAVYGSSKWLNMNRTQWLVLFSFILGSAVATYWLLLVSGGDPAWSIRRAFKWCAKREYIHVDTTPFYSMVRYSGSVLGLGLGLTSRYFHKTDRTSFKPGMVAAMALVSILLGNLADAIHTIIPKGRESVFYGSELLLNALLPYVVIAVVPYVIQGSSRGAQRLRPKKH